MTTHPNSSHPAPASPGSALYVDTENLRDNDRAQDVIAQVFAHWPADRPPVGSVSLYVRADKVALWQLWAESTYPQFGVRVRGVQHFSNSKAKNSADLAITADAVADLVTGQANAVAVVSNDSDFGALFVKVRELARAAGLEQTPFLWITSPDAGGLSPELERFIPAAFRWDLSAALAAPAPAVEPPARQTQSLPEAPKPAALPPSTASVKGNADPSSEAIAEELIRRLPVGKFKVTDAHDVFQDRWPNHPDAAGPEKFGTFLLKHIWPILQERGVLMTRKRSPRTYEITQVAKDAIAGSPTKSVRRSQLPPEPTSAQLAATIAAGITDDIFSATHALAVLKDCQSQHPAASYTAQRFGTWFAEQLWPVMEQHGVTLANEKPRRYEMTPDARHRLTSLV